MNDCTDANAAGPDAAAASHHTSSSAPTESAIPVARFRIEATMVIGQR